MVPPVLPDALELSHEPGELCEVVLLRHVVVVLCHHTQVAHRLQGVAQVGLQRREGRVYLVMVLVLVLVAVVAAAVVVVAVVSHCDCEGDMCVCVCVCD